MRLLNTYDAPCITGDQLGQDHGSIITGRGGLVLPRP